MPSTPLALFPLDDRCQLLTNLVWTPNADGVPSLHRQQLWVRLPAPARVSGLTAQFHQAVGRVRIETAEDEAGRTWRTLADVSLENSPHPLTWPAQKIGNLRINVYEPAAPGFPNSYYFSAIMVDVEAADLAAWPAPVRTVADQPLRDESPARVEPFAGLPGIHANQQLGLAHEKPRTNRLTVTPSADSVRMDSPVFSATFSRRHMQLTQLGWDTNKQNRERENLLMSARTRGAFPVVARDGELRSAESCGGTFAADGRTVTYRGIRPVPEIAWDYTFRVNEKGFVLEIDWTCEKTFHASEIAALRLPFDLFRSVVNVMAMPDPRGPSGLISLPALIQAPNYGAMRVTVRDGGPVLGRITPLRAQAELWLDLIPGALPLASGLFEMPAGRGRVVLDFTLTKVFPFGVEDMRDIFAWWEMPPFYSFVGLEPVLGALPDAWLNGISFRPDLGRFANNSVADSVALCACYYADLAAYTPMLADGLDPKQFIRVATEQMMRDRNSSIYSNWRHFPMAATSPLDCAWLYVASTGDWAWAKRWRDAIRHYADVLKQLEWQNTGLIASEQSGIPEEAAATHANMQCTWADSARSGHLESYVNAHAYRSLRRVADLLDRLDDAPGAAAARAQADRLKANFMATFYDAATKQIMQWIGRDGRRHGYRSHMHLGSAVAFGLVPEETARELLREHLAQIAARGTRYEWGLPIYLDPTPEVCHNTWHGKGVEVDGSDTFGVYQNGSLHTHQTWYFLQALYHVGLRHEANDLFIKMTALVRTGQLCGPLHSGVDWRHPVSGRPVGYEGLLSEQFHFLLAAVTGYLGCELTIDGLVINGPPTERIRMLQPNFARMAPAKDKKGS